MSLPDSSSKEWALCRITCEQFVDRLFIAIFSRGNVNIVKVEYLHKHAILMLSDKRSALVLDALDTRASNFYQFISLFYHRKIMFTFILGRSYERVTK